MMTVRGRLVVAVLLAALLPVVFSVPAIASEDETSAGFETVLRGTNDYRELNGVDRLVHDPRMSAVAQAWAERMSADYASSRNFDTAFRHNPLMKYQVPAGWEAVGENIALNSGRPDSYAYLLTQWRNSPGHNANMLNSRWTHIGIGTYQDALGITWGVQVFGDYGSPASIPDPTHAVVDLDNITYSGTANCVVLVNEPSGVEFFRQCGPRPGNVYTFSDVPPGTYSTTLLAAGGGVLYSGSPTNAAAGPALTDARVVAGIPGGIADVHSFTSGVVRCYQVTGKAGVPAGAAGVVLNVTASLPNGAGHVRVYPDYLNNGASPPPAVSTVNFEVNRDVANSTTIALPANGKVCAYSVGGTMSRMILDVLGYTLPGSGVELSTPEKLIDTRSAPQYHLGPITGPLQPMTDYTVQVGGVGSVPSDAVAVMVNITVVDTNYPGHLRMWASDQAMPNTSVVNYAPETKANSQIVALSADGKLTFRSFSWVPTTMSPVQVLVDVTGYITAESDFTATTPTTVVETRPAYSPVGLRAGALAQTTVYPLTLDTSVVPAGATAVILNVTAVQPTNFGHIRVYPDTNGLGTTTPPIMSNINFIPGRDIPNMVIVQLPPNRTIDFYTAYAGNGQTNLKVDLIGYIEGSPV